MAADHAVTVKTEQPSSSNSVDEDPQAAPPWARE